MTKHLADALGLPRLDDLMKEQGVPQTPVEAAPAPAKRQDAPAPPSAILDDQGHGKKMDAVFDEAKDHADKLFDLGYNIDPARAPRMFEVAAGLLKVAIDAANSKRDAQLKAQKLMLDAQKLDLERKAMGEIGPTTIDAEAVVVADRNTLIAKYRDADKK
jgi:hypothetical protein